MSKNIEKILDIKIENKGNIGKKSIDEKRLSGYSNLMLSIIFLMVGLKVIEAGKQKGQQT